jgi:ATP adenylyltransferase
MTRDTYTSPESSSKRKVEIPEDRSIFMHHIFAPWRIEYIKGEKYEGCIFCDFPRENNDEERLILYRGEYSFIIMNNYPYNPGHVMVAPYRHVSPLEELTDEETLDMMNNTKMIIKAIKSTMNPDGFNLGINLGRIAGAGIEDHIHFHVVPRWDGDTNFMPVLADVKVIPQAIEETYEQLRKALKK